MAKKDTSEEQILDIFKNIQEDKTAVYTGKKGETFSMESNESGEYLRVKLIHPVLLEKIFSDTRLFHGPKDLTEFLGENIQVFLDFINSPETTLSFVPETIHYAPPPEERRGSCWIFRGKGYPMMGC